MKSRGLKDFRREQELENAAFQYQLYENVMNDMMKQAVTAIIAVCEKRKYSKRYVQKLFEDLIMIIEMPDIFGQQISSNELMKQYAEKYGLDFGRINVKTESLDEYCRRYNIQRRKL